VIDAFGTRGALVIYCLLYMCVLFGSEARLECVLHHCHDRGSQNPNLAQHLVLSSVNQPLMPDDSRPRALQGETGRANTSAT